jgi:hypothetical protein
MLPMRLMRVAVWSARWPVAGLSLLAFALPAGAAPASSLRPANLQQGTLFVQAVSPMARCMATWDRSSQMSKREWKQTCKRVVKNNPGLYNKPF